MSHLAFLASLAIVAEPTPSIQVPKPPVVAPPAPAPGAVLTLSGDSLYVAQSKAEFVVRDHPKGLVRIVYEKGPLRVRARFADGVGVIESRTYDGPYIALVEAVGKGRVEMDFIPLNLKGEADIVMSTVDVDAGQGPQPPPKPDPPKPDPPKPDPKPVEGKRWVLVIEETADPVWQLQRGALVTNKALHDRIRERGHDWKLVDKDVKDSNGNVPADLAAYLRRVAGKKLPWVFVVDVAGTVLVDETYPGSPAKLLDSLKKAGG